MTAESRGGGGRGRPGPDGDLGAASMPAGGQPDPTADLAPRVADLARQVDLTNRDIDALQTEALRPKHWWKDPPTLIAILALLVSMVSPVVAQRNIASDREREDQRQLTELVQQLPGLAFGAVDERILVADAATRLMERVPSTPAQKLEVATAWGDAGYIDIARPLLEDAVTQSTQPLEKSIILRKVANLYFQLGDLDAGRAAYRDTVQLQRRKLPTLLQPNYVGNTEVQWAKDELFIAEDCEEAETHAVAAAAVLDQIADRVETYGLPEEVTALQAAIDERCPGP